MNIPLVARLAVMCYAMILAGCAAVQNPFTTDKTFAGISPPSIHRKDDAGRYKVKMKGVDEIQILQAEAKPFVDYYAALTAAATVTDPGTRQAIIDDYLLKGITVVNISCSRWFNSLAESQARLAFSQNNQNVIQNLGTTLLGFGKATSATVGTFGAIFAGLNGVQDNFSQSFLLAPNANKVKEHIFTALDQQAAELKTSASQKSRADQKRQTAVKPTTFTEAYMALEKYADICTQQTSKEIVNSALDQTTTQIQSGRGNKIVTASSQNQENEDANIETAKKLVVLQQALKEAENREDLQEVKKQLDELTTRVMRSISPSSTTTVSTLELSLPQGKALFPAEGMPPTGKEVVPEEIKPRIENAKPTR